VVKLRRTNIVPFLGHPVSPKRCKTRFRFDARNHTFGMAEASR